MAEGNLALYFKYAVNAKSIYQILIMIILVSLNRYECQKHTLLKLEQKLKLSKAYRHHRVAIVAFTYTEIRQEGNLYKWKYGEQLYDRITGKYCGFMKKNVRF